MLGPVPPHCPVTPDARSFSGPEGTATPAVTAELIAVADAGTLTPAIERTYPFADAALAHVADGHTVGKVVVTGP